MTVRHLLSTTILAAGLALAGGPAAAETVNPRQSGGIFAPSLAGSYLAGRSADSARDLKSAAAYFTAALEADPDNSILLDRVLILQIANGDIDSALSYAERLVDVDPRNPTARLLRGIEAIEKGALGRAEVEISETARAPLSDITGALLTAWAVFGSGETEAALDIINDVTGPRWFDPFKAFHTALIADLAGRDDLAVGAISDAARTAGSTLRVAEAYARILARVGQRDEATAALDQFLERQPDHPIIGDLAARIARGDELEPMVGSTIDGAAEVLYGLGSLIGSDGAVELAAAYLQLSLYLKPESHLTTLSLADQFAGAERCEDANAVYDRIPRTSSLRRNADVQTALCHDFLDNPEAAISLLEPLVADEPDDLTLVTALGSIMRGRERFEEAVDIYGKGIDTIEEVVDSHWRLFYFRGIAYERSKQWERAEADLKKALELNPDQPQVLNYLGYSWIDMGRNLEEGLNMIRKAVEQRPDDGYIVDSLGWAYYRLGQYEEAVIHLERAVELRPEDPVLNDHLGDAYWKVGRRLEATFQWNHARDLDPEPKDLEKIVRKLESGLVADGANGG
ncbi:tetratricopeptide repeat protein [Bauldia sp.]|uniref:tetratricopeptide repeat protein n=1 Tax=Bauldia sp. TaxID=2575872 RepID=UPI003BAA813A